MLTAIKIDSYWLSDQLWNQTWSEVRFPIWNQEWTRIRATRWNRAWSEVRLHVCDQIEEELNANAY